MNIYINSEPIAIEYDNDDTLGSVLSLLQDNYFEPGHIVTGIVVDGEVVTPNRLAEIKELSVEGFSEVNMIVRPANKFAAEGLITVSNHLEQSVGLRTEVVEFLQQGKMQQAMLKLNEYVQFWAGLQSTLASACRIVGIDIETMEVFDQAGNGEPVIDSVQNLSDQLGEVKSALEAGDQVLLGDILEYEFGDLTENWQSLLQKMAAQFDPECQS